MENNITKHAYLVIAHNEKEVLEYLIKSIDDVRNDIYINIDKKSKELNENEIASILKFSNIYFFHEDVRWGDESQVHCEMLLMKNANTNYKYEYYHIISGVDCIIKSQNYIHDFFEKNNGKEFIHFDSKRVCNEEVVNRITYYHIFSKFFKKFTNRYLNYFFSKLDKIGVDLQRIFRYRRKIPFEILQKGCNWCSITNELVEYILLQEEKINRMVRKSKCADEIFIQTIVANSEFKDRLYNINFNNDYQACLRYVIWNKDNLKRPKLLNMSDYKDILNSNCIIARKVSSREKSSFELVKEIYNYVGGK